MTALSDVQLRAQLDAAYNRIAQLSNENVSLQSINRQLAEENKVLQNKLNSLQENQLTLENSHLKLQQEVASIKKLLAPGPFDEIPANQLPAKTAHPTIEPNAAVRKAHSYANAVRKTVKRPPVARITNIESEEIAALVNDATPFVPTEWCKIHVRILHSKFKMRLNQCKTRQSINQVLWSVLGILNLQKQVRFWDMIGKSVVEIYTPAAHFEEVKSTLDTCASFKVIDSIANNAPQSTSTADDVEAATIRRISRLYQRAKFVKLKECILRDHPLHIQQAVRASCTTSITLEDLDIITSNDSVMDVESHQ